MPSSKFLLSALLLSSVLSYGNSAFCWADMGHTIVGGVAEENILPATKDFVRGILGVEPLEVAAIWPDHVRDDDRFGHKNQAPLPILKDDHNFGDYHFCEIPTGYTYANRPVKDVKDCHGAILGAENILKDTAHTYSHAEKIIALRYLVHVVGDIHQPLHVGNGFDIGGNACKVMWQKSADAPAVTVNLHSFWDDNLVQLLGASFADPAKKEKPAVYANDYMRSLKKRQPEMFTPEAKAKYGAGTLDQWLEEGAALRESGVYPDDPEQMKNAEKGQEYKSRPYCQWYTDQVNGVIAKGSVIDKDKIPVVGTEYTNKFVPIVETQLLKAGLRLASVLDQIAAEVAQSSKRPRVLTDAQQEKVLSGVQKAFQNADP